MTVDERIAQRDPAFIQKVCETAERLIVPYHRAEITGLEHVPAGKALFVGNHNATWWTPDTWILGAALWRHGGLNAMPFGLGHDTAIELPIARDFFPRVGAVHASPDNAARLFELGHKALVYPGGDVDAMRPFRHRNRITFHGRRGYIRLALASRAPIVPIVTQGAHGSLIILDDWSWAARATGLSRFLRIKAFPITLSFPFGLGLGPLALFVPFPVKIRMTLMPAMRFEHDGPEAAADPEYVARCAAEVEGKMQAELDRLARLS